MRNIFKILTLIGTLGVASCEDLFLDFFYSPSNVSGIVLTSGLEKELSKINSLEELTSWIYNNIKYTNKEPIAGRWQTPQETLDSKEGDCEDFSLLEMKLANMKWGIKPELAVLVYDKRGYNYRIYYKHAVVRQDGKYFDSTVGKEIDIRDWSRINEIFTYDGAFYLLSEYIKEEKDSDGLMPWYKSLK